MHFCSILLNNWSNIQRKSNVSLTSHSWCCSNVMKLTLIQRLIRDVKPTSEFWRLTNLHIQPNSNQNLTSESDVRTTSFQPKFACWDVIWNFLPGMGKILYQFLFLFKKKCYLSLKTMIKGLKMAGSCILLSKVVTHNFFSVICSPGP